MPGDSFVRHLDQDMTRKSGNVGGMARLQKLPIYIFKRRTAVAVRLKKRERRAARAARAASSPGLLLLKKGPPSARSIQARRKGRGRRNAPSRPRAAARATATMTLRRPRPPAPPRRSRRESAASATNHCRRAPSAKISGKKVPKEGATTAKGRAEVEENLLHQMKKT